MKRYWPFVVIAITAVLIVFAYSAYISPQEKPEEKPDSQQLANPASVYCVNQSYKLEIRSDAQGNQYGVCIFPDGSECEEWAFYRGTCLP